MNYSIGGYLKIFFIPYPTFLFNVCVHCYHSSSSLCVLLELSYNPSNWSFCFQNFAWRFSVGIYWTEKKKVFTFLLIILQDWFGRIYVLCLLIWTVKKAEHWKIDAFELWCWRRLLRVPWTARRSNQSILKEISPGCSLGGLVLKLKLQYFFGHLMWRVDSLEKTLRLGGIGGRRRRDSRGWDGWMVSPTQCAWVWINTRSWWWTGRPGVLWFMGSQRVGHDWVTELNWCYAFIKCIQPWNEYFLKNSNYEKYKN